MSIIKRKLIDIGANLTDEMFQGVYHSSRKHQPDLHFVLQRAWNAGLDKIIITGTDLMESKRALEIAETDSRLFITVGCHPTKCNEFDATDPDQYLNSLLQLIVVNFDKVVAVGECGLDYERTQFCSIEKQKKYFEKQLFLAKETKLPLFLHCRNAANDLVQILEPYRATIVGGVVHSFDGTEEEMKRILDLNLFIGINGCSLKTNENLTVASKIPSNKLLIETDCPWCEIRPSSASFKHIRTILESRKNHKWDSCCLVKGRNEPCNLVQMLEVLSAFREESCEELARITFDNTVELFFSR